MKRNILNVFMSLGFLLLMDYRLTANLWHEVLGVGILLAFILHTRWNRHWYGSFWRGRQTPCRIWGSMIIFFCGLAFLASLGSGLAISRSLLPFLAVKGVNTLWLHDVHQASSYGAFLLAGLHLGMHWPALWQRFQRFTGLCHWPRAMTAVGAISTLGFLILGILAFDAQHMGAMLMMQYPAVLIRQSGMHCLRNLSLLFGFYVMLGHYTGKWLRRFQA
jgi:hypothetical protein